MTEDKLKEEIHKLLTSYMISDDNCRVIKEYGVIVSKTSIHEDSPLTYSTLFYGGKYVGEIGFLVNTNLDLDLIVPYSELLDDTQTMIAMRLI